MKSQSSHGEIESSEFRRGGRRSTAESSSKRLGRRRGFPLKLGRNLPLWWPLHGGPLHGRSSRRATGRSCGNRSRGNGGGRSRRAGTRPGSSLTRLRNAHRCRSRGNVAAGHRCRWRGGLGPLGTSGQSTDSHGQGRCGHRTPQTTHVHRTRSSRRSIRRIGQGVRLKPRRAATHACRRHELAAGPAKGPAATRERISRSRC